MASINGIEFKGIKDFKGHEQETLSQANVYYKGKKVGFWSQDSWGGCDNFNLDYELSKELKEEINNILNNYVSGTIFGGINKLYDEKYGINLEHKEFKGYEYLFTDLLELKEQEDLYKKYSKMWGFNNIAICYKDLFDSVIKGSKLSKTMFEETLKVNKEIKLYYIYSGKEDFNKVV